jgi:hypothetical protein
VIRMAEPNCCFSFPTGQWPAYRKVSASTLFLAYTLIFPVYSQALLPGNGERGSVNLFNSDLSVLEIGEARSDLPCKVTPDDPGLGFDMRFHAGYEVTLPLRELAGSDNMLTILFRVFHDGQKDKPVYFTQRIRVPYIEDEARGEAALEGAFDLGPGKYHVEWLMRDRSERVCSSSWDTEATLAPKDRELTPALSDGAIERASVDEFQEEPPIRRVAQEPLNVKVLINFAPSNMLSATMLPIDTNALVSILRTICREPRIGRFSITAFNLQEQKVLYHQEDADRINFPALGEALHSIKLGTVGIQQLAVKHGDTDFLTDLIKKEAGNSSKHPDALVFAGPKAMLEANVPATSLKDIGELDFPVFYMNYNRNPQAVPWRDAIGNAVKVFHGSEYTITRPRDLWFAVGEMVSHIVKSRNERAAASISTH